MTPPTVAVTGPASALPNADGIIAVTGTAIDGHGIASVEVSTTPNDPDSWQEATTDWVTPRPDEDEWTQETVRWSFDMEELGIGTTQLSVRAIDLAGNASAPSVFTVVRDVPAASYWNPLAGGNLLASTANNWMSVSQVPGQLLFRSALVRAGRVEKLLEALICLNCIPTTPLNGLRGICKLCMN